MNPLRNYLPALLGLAFASSAPAVQISILTDGFEGYPVAQLPTQIPNTATVNPPPPGLTGDLAEIVTAHNGVSPRNGAQMLRFLDTDYVLDFTAGSHGDLYYYLDLSTYASSIALGAASIDLSAWFNTGAGGDHGFFLGLLAYDSSFQPNDIRSNNPPSRVADSLNFLSNPLTTDSGPCNLAGEHPQSSVTYQH